MATTIYCNGINHSDYGKQQACKKCGKQVVRREDGKVFDLRHYHTSAGNERTAFSCYMRHTWHECNETAVRLYADEKQAKVDAGEMCIDQQVIVARGRKFPKGTRGRITWVGSNEYGERARVQPTDGEAFFIAIKNLDVVP